MTITLTGLSLNPLSSVAYLDPFNPTNIALNYLGDAGASSTQPGPSVSYGVTVPAFTTFDVVVNEVNSGGDPAEYGLTVAGNGGIIVGTTAVPENSRGIIVISVFFFALVMQGRRFRRLSVDSGSREQIDAV